MRSAHRSCRRASGAPRPPGAAAPLRGLAGALLPLLALPPAAAQDGAEPPAPADEAARTAEPEAAPEVPPDGLTMTLEAALAIAEHNNIGLRMQESATEAARYDARGAWGSFDWVLDASVTAVDEEQPNISFLSGSGGDPSVEEERLNYSVALLRPVQSGGTFQLRYDSVRRDTGNVFFDINPSYSDTMTASFTQPLLRGFGDDYATSIQHEAELAYERSREGEREARQTLRQNVHDAYWDLVLGKEELDVAISGMELAGEQLERNRRLLDAGVGTEVEVIQAEAELATRIQAVLLAQDTARAAEDALKQIVFPGVDTTQWDTAILPATPLPDVVEEVEIAPWDTLLDTALHFRPNVRQQQLALRESELRHERAASERKLGLDLTVAATSASFAGSTGDAIDDAVTFEYPTFSATLGFNAPIGNRSRRNAARAARERVRAARLALEDVQSQVAGEVRDAVRQVRYQVEAVRAARTSVAATERQLDAEQARYRNDLSTNFEVLQFQDQLVQALSSERRARADFAKALVRLRAVQGTLGEEQE